MEKIPGAGQIRNVLEGTEPGGLYGAFDLAFEAVWEEGVQERYRVLNGTIPVVLDGTWYFSSEEIDGEHCLTMEKKEREGGGAVFGLETDHIRHC